MRDVLEDVLAWWAAGETVGVGTVIQTFLSAPRQPGAAMAVGPGGEVVGSVSGGCVEGAVYELAETVVASRRPVLQHYGVTDDDAFAVGLTCGGELDVWVEPVSRSTFPELAEVAESVQSTEPVAVATVVAGPQSVGSRLCVWPGRTSGSLGDNELDRVVATEATEFLAAGHTGILRVGVHGERVDDALRVFVASYAPAPRMLVYGASDFAAAVTRVGAFLGYRVTVCDARAVFATRRRFPGVEEVVVEWPHRHFASVEVDNRTVVCVLTHDPKFDVPVLELALRSPAAYVGAMGSRRTHEDRVLRLREAGLTDTELASLHSPIGLDIGARTPEETAVSVAAGIIGARSGRSGTPLREGHGSIHAGVGAPERPQTPSGDATRGRLPLVRPGLFGGVEGPVGRLGGDRRVDAGGTEC